MILKRLSSTFIWARGLLSSVRMSTILPLFMRMEVHYFANSARQWLKTDASQILTKTSWPTVIVRMPKMGSLSSERGMKNHYKITALQIRKAEETLKLTKPLILFPWIICRSQTMPFMRKDRMGTLCHPNDALDANSQQPPSILVKVHLELKNLPYFTCAQCSCGSLRISRSPVVEFSQN